MVARFVRRPQLASSVIAAMCYRRMPHVQVSTLNMNVSSVVINGVSITTCLPSMYECLQNVLTTVMSV